MLVTSVNNLGSLRFDDVLNWGQQNEHDREKGKKKLKKKQRSIKIKHKSTTLKIVFLQYGILKYKLFLTLQVLSILPC
jgi:hypothetical protein